MEDQKHLCQGKAKVFAGYCDRKPTVIREGKHYCWQHDPDRLRKIADKKRKEFALRMAAEEKNHLKQIRRKMLLEDSGIAILTEEELEMIIRLGGIKKILTCLQQGVN